MNDAFLILAFTTNASMISIMELLLAMCHIFQILMHFCIAFPYLLFANHFQLLTHLLSLSLTYAQQFTVMFWIFW